MDLIFEKKEQYFGKDAAWVSEFEVTSDFNLHVERISGGRFLVYQKSVADGEYDLVDGLGYKDHKDTIDMDFVALVYPKYIKVVSEAEVTRAVVLPEGVAKQIGGKSMIEFEFEGETYQAEEGMTWGEFIASSYNDGMFTEASGFVRHDGRKVWNGTSGSYVMPSDIINDGDVLMYPEM